MPVADLYRPDGIDHMVKGRDGSSPRSRSRHRRGPRSTYLKLRRRRAVDFPMLGVAAAVRPPTTARSKRPGIVPGAIAPAPLRAAAAEEFLTGRRLTRRWSTGSQIAAGPVRPFDTMPTSARYRKWMAAVFVARALRNFSLPGRG